jgi:hypothetical protein
LHLARDEKLWVTQTSAAEASTNRVNEKIVAARKTLEPEPSPLSVRKTAGGYEDFTRCRVEPIRAQGLKNGSEKKTGSAGSRQLTGNRDRSTETRSQQQKSGPDALGEEQAGPCGTNQTEIWVRLPQRKNTANKKETRQRTSSRENALKTSALTGHRTSTLDKDLARKKLTGHVLSRRKGI